MTLFTRTDGKGGYSYREDRPVLLLSSTSYTPDEDFMVMLKALEQLYLKKKEFP